VRSPTTPCTDCKHWSPKDFDDGWDVPRGVRKCSRAVAAWEVSEWVKDDDSGTERRIKPEYVNQKMFTADASSCCALFLTRGDFHCSEHEPKV
jgi:hypothetical protein